MQWDPDANSGEDLSCGAENIRVPWENNVDSDKPTTHSFTYVTTVIEGEKAGQLSHSL